MDQTFSYLNLNFEGLRNISFESIWLPIFSEKGLKCSHHTEVEPCILNPRLNLYLPPAKRRSQMVSTYKPQASPEDRVTVLWTIPMVGNAQEPSTVW